MKKFGTSLKKRYVTLAKRDFSISTGARCPLVGNHRKTNLKMTNDWFKYHTSLHHQLAKSAPTWCPDSTGLLAFQYIQVSWAKRLQPMQLDATILCQCCNMKANPRLSLQGRISKKIAIASAFPVGDKNHHFWPSVTMLRQIVLSRFGKHAVTAGLMNQFLRYDLCFCIISSLHVPPVEVHVQYYRDCEGWNCSTLHMLNRARSFEGAF